MKLLPFLAAFLCIVPAHAQPIRVGMINVLTGAQADAGVQLDNGAKTYLKMHGEPLPGRRIDLVRRDTGGAAPALARRLANDLIVLDKAEILAGFLLAPNALAAAEVAAQANKLMVVMHASVAPRPYVVSTAVTGAYDPALEQPVNRAFVREFQAMHGRLPDAHAVGGYDGMHAIYQALRRTGGKTDGDALLAAMKGLKWDSPRGPLSLN